MKKYLLLALAAVLALSSFGCTKAGKNGSYQETGTLAASEVQTTAAKPEEGGIHAGNYLKKSKFKFSFVKAKQYTEIKESEFYTNTPAAGNVYLVLFFDVENVSDKNQYINPFYFKAYQDNYEVDDKSILITKIDGYSTFSGGDLAPGKKSKGYLAYELPADWKNLEVTYKEMYDSKAYNFIVTPQDLG